jgi:hypothetical protein
MYLVSKELLEPSMYVCRRTNSAWTMLTSVNMEGVRNFEILCQKSNIVTGYDVTENMYRRGPANFINTNYISCLPCVVCIERFRRWYLSLETREPVGKREACFHFQIWRLKNTYFRRSPWSLENWLKWKRNWPVLLCVLLTSAVLVVNPCPLAGGGGGGEVAWALWKSGPRGDCIMPVRQSNWTTRIRPSPTQFYVPLPETLELCRILSKYLFDAYYFFWDLRFSRRRVWRWEPCEYRTV